MTTSNYDEVTMSDVVSPSTMADRSVRSKATALLAVVAFAAALVTTYIVLQPTTTPLLYPVGVPSAAAPSGDSVPNATQSFLGLQGYHQSYVTEFTGTTLPKGWFSFSGPIHGDAEAYYDPSHLHVANGLLTLRTARDPLNHGNWATAGLCQCGTTHVEGAYFVRSRSLGVGPDNVELLWPKTDIAPPAVEFMESAATSGSSASVHWSSQNHTIHLYLNKVSLTNWNTWGVVWTKTKLIFVVNGRAWATITDRQLIPTSALRLDLEQQTYCSFHYACPSGPASMLVDWVAEYQR